MKESSEGSKSLKIMFSLALLGAFYGGLIGAGIALITGNNAWSWALAGAGAGAWAGAWALAGALALVLAGALALALALEYFAKRNKTTPEALVEEHIRWLLSFPIALVRFLFTRKSSINSHKKLEAKQRAWDVSLIITFTQELTEIFPEEWDDWQHWINDMMELRTRMQSKGMNHRLVSLITFYRLFRFALHIGIDKVFILATRRATR